MEHTTLMRRPPRESAAVGPHLGPGMRRTRQRQIVWEVLAEQRQHLTADEIFGRVRRVEPRIARSTVYRALEAMEVSGDVLAAHLGGASVRYEVAERPHHHAICQLCGRVEHLDEQLVHAMEHDVQRAIGFTPVRTELTIVGVCAACARAASPAGRHTPLQGSG